MICKGDSVRLEIEFAAQGIRAHVHRMLDERSHDLKAMIDRFCDDLAADSEIIERKIKQQVETLWHQELNRFITQTAQGRVYEEMDKVRMQLAKPKRKVKR